MVQTKSLGETIGAYLLHMLNSLPHPAAQTRDRWSCRRVSRKTRCAQLVPYCLRSKSLTSDRHNKHRSAAKRSKFRLMPKHCEIHASSWQTARSLVQACKAQDILGPHLFSGDSDIQGADQAVKARRGAPRFCTLSKLCCLSAQPAKRSCSVSD